MNVTEFKAQLLAHPDKLLTFVLPDGGFIPAHFHITEVGHVQRNFVDCGGTRRRTEACLLQTWVASDDDHRLNASKLAKIFSHASDVLPSEDLPVEIEYEDYVVSQFPVTGVQVADGALLFTLGLKHTDCLAKELCLPSGGCCSTEGGCCS
jgi:Family of unknown function (DUF6428)